MDTAYCRPVELIEHGRRKYVVMATDHHDRIVHAVPRKSYYHPDDPGEVKTAILAALDADGEPHR